MVCLSGGMTLTIHIGEVAQLVPMPRSSSLAEGAMLLQTLHRLREMLATQVSRASDAKASVRLKGNGCGVAIAVVVATLGLMPSQR